MAEATYMPSSKTASRSFPYRTIVAVILLIALFFASGMTSAKAQGDVLGEVMLGLKSGLTSMTVSGNSISNDVNRRNGFMIGGFATIDYAKVEAIGFRSEAMYIQKGASSPDQEIEVNYLDTSLLLDIYAPLDGNIAPHVFVGPTAGVYLNGNLGNVEEDKVNFEEYTVVFGGGLNVNASFGLILIETRYQLGLTSIYDFADLDTVRNQGVTVELGVAF